MPWTDHLVEVGLALEQSVDYAALGGVRGALGEQPGIASAQLRVHDGEIKLKLRLSAADAASAGECAAGVLREVLEKAGWARHVRRMTLDIARST